MRKLLGFAAFLILTASVSNAQAGYWRNGVYYYYPNEVRARAPIASQPMAPVQGGRRSYSYAPSSGVWPYYPNYGNSTGAAYSRAAGMRQGQVYGTFGQRPADARARGNY